MPDVDRKGNHAADAMATQGVQMHPNNDEYDAYIAHWGKVQGQVHNCIAAVMTAIWGPSSPLAGHGKTVRKPR